MLPCCQKRSSRLAVREPGGGSPADSAEPSRSGARGRRSFGPPPCSPPTPGVSFATSWGQNHPRTNRMVRGILLTRRWHPAHPFRPRTGDREGGKLSCVADMQSFELGSKASSREKIFLACKWSCEWMSKRAGTGYLVIQHVHHNVQALCFFVRVG